MLNYDLAKRRQLSKRSIKDLEALHDAVNILVNAWNLEELHGRNNQYVAHSWARRKRMRKTIRRIEYIMQDKWGFERNKAKHTHWRRFKGL